MVSKAEYLFITVRVRNLREAIAEYEFKDETYEMWKKWEKMNPEEKKKLREAWDEYYVKCQNSGPGQRFWEMYPAFKAKDIQTLNRLAEQGKRLAGEGHILKPSSVDPEELNMKMWKYFDAVKTLKTLEQIVDEFEPVYGAKDKSKNPFS